MLLIAALSAFSVPFICYLARVRRQVMIVSWYLVIAQLVGVFPRALVTDNGWDRFIGPYQPEWINPALWMIISYNLFFMVGILFGHFVTIKRKGNQTETESVKPTLGRKAMLISLVICSIPGLIMLLVGPHHTLLNDSNIYEDRHLAAGLGPVSLLEEIPYTALIVWYSYMKGKVKLKWWIALILLLVLSILGGTRSQVLDFIMVLIALKFIQTESKLKKTTWLMLIIVGLVLLYAGWIVVYCRGMMHDYGGSFMTWAAQAASMNPLQAYNSLMRASLNGWDGLVSVVGTVPSIFPYHNGELWYQMATILIPRAIWHSKWTVDIVNQFTSAVWGWVTGGNFVTAAGAMYLDSGPVGVMFGSVFLGAATSILCRAKTTPTSNHWFARIVVAVWCFFIGRFTFAGGSQDADLSARIIVEMLVILLVAKLVSNRRSFVMGSRDKIGHIHNIR
jgi:oligosaccharide repeat unit polymerase